MASCVLTMNVYMDPGCYLLCLQDTFAMAEQPTAAKSTAPLSRLAESLPASDTTADVPVQSALWATSINGKMTFGRSTENSSEAQQLLSQAPTKQFEYSIGKPIGKRYIDAYACICSSGFWSIVTR